MRINSFELTNKCASQGLMKNICPHLLRIKNIYNHKKLSTRDLVRPFGANFKLIAMRVTHFIPNSFRRREY